MSRRENLVALGASDEPETGPGPEDQPTPEAAETYPEDAADFEDAWEEEAPRRSTGWIIPTLGVIAIMGWTGFFGWIHQSEILAGAPPQAWADWIVSWSVPVLLVIGVWLLAMRNSTREAARFGETARLLSHESQGLETRLVAVNRELSLARDFIASQSRDLESLGRVASERLSTNADRLEQLIRENGEQVNSIGQVSDTALSNMEKLRDRLPVIANAARDVASQIGNAGITAQGQLDEMISGFDRLNQFGEASTAQVEGLRAKVGDTLASFEAQTTALEQLCNTRFEALRGQSEDFRQELEARETDTLAAIRRRAEELQTELSARSDEVRAREEAAIADMRERIADLRSEADRLTLSMRDGQTETQRLWETAIEGLQARMTDAIGTVSRIDEAAIESARARLEKLSQIAERADTSIKQSTEAFDEEFARRQALAVQREEQALAQLQGRISAFDQQVNERQEEHLAHVVGLAERGDALAQRLAALDQELSRLSEQGKQETGRLSEASELLAERLSHSRAILEENGTFVGRLTDDSVRLLEIIRSSADYSQGALCDSIGKAESRLSQFEQQAMALRDTIVQAEAKGSLLSDHVGTASLESRASLETIEALEARMAELAQQSTALAEQARTELQSAIAEMEAASGEMVSKLRSEQTDAVREIAERIGTQGSSAIEQALREGASAAIAELQEAAHNAGERGRESAAELRNQLAIVNELTGNLEQRVSQARERAAEQVDSDFTRRMALITDSLNSCSIDISKAFDNEVTDTSWASYLRGDRGIFTRRAVRLLDNHDARAVSDIYQDDAEFREAVNRYIHDFEAMLRNVLSTRDGNALAVTLLSSDMGKLYVALAQAIERLRD
ncbi:hypothetical protein GCM10009127_20920 [Alteraurantiacibacter aestuarii]|uniref:ATPase n=1 Tax=Alteraurantiacibacter aestuarii TaxID=650004 RepID=UPI0031D7C505